MKHLRRIIPGVLLAAALPLLGQTSRPQPPTRRPLPRNTAHPANPDRGQQVFNQNCSRCHNAPEGFPPSVSGTIAMHMRVRANLSEADYKALLRFLNP